MQINFLTKQRLTDSRLVVAKGAGVGHRRSGSLRLADANRCTEQTNQVLLCNTEHYIQYPVINHNGKEYEKDTYVFV